MPLYPSNLGQGRRIIRCSPEAVSGTAEDLTGANAPALYAYSFDLLTKRLITPRDLVSPSERGIPAISSQESTEVSFEADVVLQTITSANSSDVPINLHPALVGSGWTCISENSTDSHTYILGGQGSSLTFREIMLDETNENHRIKSAYGVRGDLVISAQAGEVVKIQYNGVGANLYNQIEVLEGSAYEGSITFPSKDLQPILFENVSFRFYNIDEDLLYGGGDLATPTGVGALKGFTFSANRNPGLRKSAQSSSAIANALLEGDRPTLELVLEMNNNIVSQFQKDRDVFEVLITIPQVNTNNTFSLLCYGTIDGDLAGPEIGDGVYLVRVPLSLVYPPDISDNNPQGGQDPFRKFSTGTNRGLPIVPTGIVQGLAAIQVRTTA